MGSIGVSMSNLKKSAAEKEERVLNIKYLLAMALYLCTYCAIVVFASVYLLAKGYSNFTIGCSFALVSLLVILTQPVIAAVADNRRGREVIKLITIFLLVSIVASGQMLFLKMPSPFLLPLFMIVEYCLLIIQPLINALAFVFEPSGVRIHFGMARGCGSAVFGIVSVLLGRVIVQEGVDAIPAVYFAANAFLIFVIYNYGKEMKLGQARSVETQTSSLPLGMFCKKYKRFIFFIFGTIFVYFSHVIIFNYFIHIVTMVGGTENDMGKAIFLSTMLEAVATVLLPFIIKRTGCSVLLKVAAVMFIVRNIIMCAASNLSWIYIGSAFQLVSYAIMYSGSIYYANLVVSRQDRVKSQALVAMNYTASGIFASFAGGAVIDLYGIRQALVLGTAASCIGAVLIFLSVEEKKEAQDLSGG